MVQMGCWSILPTRALKFRRHCFRANSLLVMLYDCHQLEELALGVDPTGQEAIIVCHPIQTHSRSCMNHLNPSQTSALTSLTSAHKEAPIRINQKANPLLSNALSSPSSHNRGMMRMKALLIASILQNLVWRLKRHPRKSDQDERASLSWQAAGKYLGPESNILLQYQARPISYFQGYFAPQS